MSVHPHPGRPVPVRLIIRATVVATSAAASILLFVLEAVAAVPR